MNDWDGPPITGNIYCDGWWDQGHYYREYTIDCAECGNEVCLELRRKRTKTRARLIGWVEHPKHGKWTCPECRSKIEEAEVNRDQMPPDGYAIRTKWISPMEGTEYMVCLMGGETKWGPALAVRKSWKAACRAAWKHSEGKKV